MGRRDEETLHFAVLKEIVQTRRLAASVFIGEGFPPTLFTGEATHDLCRAAAVRRLDEFSPPPSQAHASQTNFFHRPTSLRY
jgi:hypothetical protein